jgi:hypothetical protein
MIPLLINQSNISLDFFLAIVDMSSRFRSSCYWTDWNWANTENIHIGLVFAVLAQCKFLYCIGRSDHIKANKSKLINNDSYIIVTCRYLFGKCFCSDLQLISSSFNDLIAYLQWDKLWWDKITDRVSKGTVYLN